MSAPISNISDPCADGIPYPIVRLNRIVILASVVIALVTQQPLVLTALFLVLLPAAVFGRRGSLIYSIGSRLFAREILTAPKEEKHTQRFNNIIATVFLAISNLGFFGGSAVVGWAFAIGVAAAATVALLGFCVGCFIFYQFKLGKRRFFAALNE